MFLTVYKTHSAASQVLVASFLKIADATHKPTHRVGRSFPQNPQIVFVFPYTTLLLNISHTKKLLEESL
jgi:hypothetical protein